MKTILRNILKKLRKNELTEHEQKLVNAAIKDVREGKIVVNTRRAPGGLQSKPSKRDILYPVWQEYVKLNGKK